MFNGSSGAGGHPPEETRLLHLVAAVYLALLAALGVAGNALVLACVVRMAQLRHLTYILVSNLSAVGLLSCLVTIPVHITHLLLGGSVWQYRQPAACKVLAHLNFGLVLCTLLNSAAIALCRYRSVSAKHGTRHQAMPTLKIVRLILFIWAFPTLVTISASPFLGFNALLWDCFLLNADNAFWYTNMALAVPALVSTLCMLIAYVLIVKKVRESRMKISNLCHKPVSITDNAGAESREEKSESEVRKDPGGHSPHSAAVPGPSSVTVIKIFTTMISDSPASSMPSPSCSMENYTPAPFPRPPDRGDVAKRPSPGSSSQGPTYLLPAASPHLTLNASPQDLTVLSPRGGKCMDTLSVPSRSSVSSLSQDTVSTAREDSLLSASFSSATQCQAQWRRKRRVRREVKLSLHLFLAFLLFCLLYLPLCLAHVLHAVHAVGREGWLLLYTLALSFASNAWLVYALLNHDFRRAFRALLQGRRSF